MDQGVLKCWGSACISACGAHTHWPYGSQRGSWSHAYGLFNTHCFLLHGCTAISDKSELETFRGNERERSREALRMYVRGEKMVKKKLVYCHIVYCFTPFSPLATYLIFNIIFYLNLSIMSQPEMAVKKKKAPLSIWVYCDHPLSPDL